MGNHSAPRQKSGPYRINVRDAAADFLVVYFHARGDYLQKLLPTGQRRLISGKVELFDGIGQMVHPDHVLRPDEAAELPGFEPVYPLTAGVTQRVVAKAAAAALARLPALEEWIDGPLLAREGWPNLATALAAAHAPSHVADLMAESPARQRLAYDELFAYQLTLALARLQMRRGKGLPTRGTGKLQAKVLESLTFQPTGAQIRALGEIAQDMESPAPDEPAFAG